MQRDRNRICGLLAICCLGLAAAVGGGAFGCGGGTDLVPSVVSTTPTNGATSVPVANTIEGAFNEAMDPATLNAATFVVTAPDGSAVTGVVSYAADTFKASFASTDPLLNNAAYSVRISSQVTDTAGTPMAADYQWSFTTELAPQKQFSMELDAGFGSGGKFDSDLGMSKTDIGNAVIVQSDGTTLQSGYVGWTGVHAHDADIGILRVDGQGLLDPTFGAGGIAIMNDCDSFWGLQWWTLVGMALQSDGKILLGGECQRFARIYRLNANGTLDAAFGTGGHMDLPKDIGGGNWSGVFSLAVQSDGAGGEKVVVGGIANTVADWAVNPVWLLARLNSDGSLDATFGDQPAHPGIVLEAWSPTSNDGIRDLIVLADRRIVAYGNTSTDATAKQDFAFARFTADGVLDTTFGINGLSVVNFNGDDWSYSAAILPDGRLAGGEHVNCCFATSRFGAFVVSAEGALDPAFGTGGEVTIDFGTNEQQIGNAIGALPDGRLIIGGEVNDGAGGWDHNDFGLTLLNADGTVETEFGTNGFIITDFNGLEDGILKLAISEVEFDTSGNISSFVVTASGHTTDPASPPSDFALARYRSVVVETPAP